MRLKALFLSLSLILVALSGGQAVQAEIPFPPLPRGPKPPAGLDAALYRLWQGWQTSPLLAQAWARAQGVTLHEGAVQVVVEALPGKGDAALQAIAGRGGTVQARYDDFIQAMVPVDALMALLGDEGVLRIRPPMRPQAQAIVSEGLAVVGAHPWYQAGITGQGVKVAVIDVGFEGAEALQRIELPAQIVVRDFTSPRPPDICESSLERRHGTAVAEIVHDMAPRAQLLLARVDTDVAFAQAVEWALQQGARVINLSGGFLAAPPAGVQASSDLIGRAVDSATQAGVFWANAAGNHALGHWTGPATDADSDGWVEFAPNDEVNGVYLAQRIIACVSIILKWDDPWPGACHDFDLYVGYVDPYGQDRLAGVSDDTQDCSAAAQPLEGVFIGAPILTLDGALYIGIATTGGTGGKRLQLLVSDGLLQYAVPQGSVLPPADRAGVVAVGAVPYHSPGTLEPFSSQGPTLDGRIKPDLVAPDRVSTSAYGPQGFPGTSAAAPATWGAAALMLQAHPQWTAQQVYQFLAQRARDLGELGKDNRFGAGLLQMGPPPGPSTQPLLWGDVDCNNSVNAVDALQVLRSVVGLPVLQTEPCPDIGATVTVDGMPRKWGDVDCNSSVDAVDALRILRFVVGLPVQGQQGCPMLGQRVSG